MHEINQDLKEMRTSTAATFLVTLTILSPELQNNFLQLTISQVIIYILLLVTLNYME